MNLFNFFSTHSTQAPKGAFFLDKVPGFAILTIDTSIVRTPRAKLGTTERVLSKGLFLFYNKYVDLGPWCI